MYVIITMSSHIFTGPVFGNMDNFTGLGVFVDTYPNEEKHIEVCHTRPANIPTSTGTQSRVTGQVPPYDGCCCRFA